jgi:hypothetical protein
VLLTTVLLALSETKLILSAEIRTQGAEPTIMIEALACPDSRGVVLIPDRLIATLSLAFL